MRQAGHAMASMSLLTSGGSAVQLVAASKAIEAAEHWGYVQSCKLVRS